MIRKDIKALSAYKVQDASGMIKLDAMENPYPLPAALKTEWAKALKKIDVNRYPDADMKSLREKIAARDGVKPEQVLIGNGSDEIIQMLLMAADAGPCISPGPSFVMYGLISKWLKRPTTTFPLEKDFSLDGDKFMQMCAREKAAVVFLACPNNPTGNLWPESTIKQIAANFRGILVIDEAYFPFADRNHVKMIAPNVVVLRTFSKVGWAGLRFGYLLGDAKLIQDLNKVRLPYNINSLTQASAEFFLDHFEEFEKQTEEIRQERTRVTRALMNEETIELFPSQTNFLLMRVKDANKTFEALKAKGILIKNMHGADPLLDNCLRITIGTPKENDACLKALKESIA